MHQRAPEFRVLRLPRWRVDGERVLVDDAQTEVEQSWNLWTADVLEGLAADEPYERLVDRIQARWPVKERAWCEAVVRRFFYTLHRLKAIELVFESPKAFGRGRYETLKELGRGGVGVAWLCRDRTMAREVVVKRAWDYFAPLAKTDALVRGETEVMRRLDHPGIAKPYDAFEEGGLHHLVREFARGEELSKWRGKGVQDDAVRRRLAREIADVVAHLHERGYILLDLRPANFFVDPATMKPMLIDVGHCKPLTDGVVDLGVPKPGRAHGSPGFAAPETLEGRASPRTDVWGFGRLYYFMTTGQLPKQPMTTADLLAKMEALGAPEIDRRAVERCANDAVDARPASMREAVALLDSRGTET